MSDHKTRPVRDRTSQLASVSHIPPTCQVLSKINFVRIHYMKNTFDWDTATPEEIEEYVIALAQKRAQEILHELQRDFKRILSAFNNKTSH